MKLNGEQLGAFAEALRVAYDRASLERMLRYSLDVELEDVTLTNASMPDMVFKLLTWAQGEGRLEDLLAAALKEKPGNQDLRLFADSLQRVPAEDPSAPEETQPDRVQAPPAPGESMLRWWCWLIQWGLKFAIPFLFAGYAFSVCYGVLFAGTAKAVSWFTGRERQSGMAGLLSNVVSFLFAGLAAGGGAAGLVYVFALDFKLFAHSSPENVMLFGLYFGGALGVLGGITDGLINLGRWRWRYAAALLVLLLSIVALYLIQVKALSGPGTVWRTELNVLTGITLGLFFGFIVVGPSHHFLPARQKAGRVL